MEGGGGAGGGGERACERVVAVGGGGIFSKIFTRRKKGGKEKEKEEEKRGKVVNIYRLHCQSTVCFLCSIEIGYLPIFNMVNKLNFSLQIFCCMIVWSGSRPPEKNRATSYNFT